MMNNGPCEDEQADFTHAFQMFLVGILRLFAAILPKTMKSIFFLLNLS